MALVNFENVAAAAEQIEQAGGRPSVRTVIAHLGGGSPNAVGPLLNEWRAGRVTIKAAEVTLDPRIAAILGEQIQQAAKDAAKAAEDRAAVIQEDADAVAEAGRAAEVEAQWLTQQLAEVKAKLEAQAEQTKLERAERESDKAHYAELIASLKAELQAERERSNALNAELVRAHVQLEQLPTLDDVMNLRIALARAETRLEGSKPPSPAA